MPQTLFERATNNIGIYIYSIRQNETKVCIDYKWN